MDGKFSLQTRKGIKLEFSFIGFLTETVEVTGPVINVSLREDSEMLDEVVVIGYGTMKRSDLTGAVASVSAEEISKTVATSLDQVLQGRAAGVAVTQNSGAPGGGISVFYGRQFKCLVQHQPGGHRVYGGIEGCFGKCHLRVTR